MTIKFDLQSQAKLLGKNIADITRETGLNRNTVTSLYYGKIEGIKFETLAKLCEIYNFDITDILALEKTEKMMQGYYGEAREISPFYYWPWFMLYNNPPKEFFGDVKSMEKSKAYFKKEQGIFYADVNLYTQIASFVLNKYRDKNEFKRLRNKIAELAEVIKDVYFEMQSEKVNQMSQVDFINYCKNINQKIIEFSLYTSFMHTLDNNDLGKKELSRLCQVNKITDQDLISLTRPINLLYNQQKFLAEMNLARKLKSKKIAADETTYYLKTFIKNDPAVKEYRQNFNYYNYKFNGGEDFKDSEIFAVLQNLLNNYDLFNKKYQQLLKYSEQRQRIVTKTLKRLKLRENPLFFFQSLVEMRENRKMSNQMMCAILEKMLVKVHKISGINLTYLRFLGSDEIESVLNGFLTEDVLRNRYEQGIMMYIADSNCKIVVGLDADKMKKEVAVEIVEPAKPLYFFGRIFNQGFARGLAMSPENDLEQIKDNILIIDDYDPSLDKKILTAAGVVTTKVITKKRFVNLIQNNYIPCVQEIKNIKGQVKYGEVIDLRANHGTVVKVKA